MKTVYSIIDIIENNNNYNVLLVVNILWIIIFSIIFIILFYKNRNKKNKQSIENSIILFSERPFIVEYCLTGCITKDSFLAYIIQLIKNNLITLQYDIVINSNKKNYYLTKGDLKDQSRSDITFINNLFNLFAEDNKLYINEICKKLTNKTIQKTFTQLFQNWINERTEDAQKENFYKKINLHTPILYIIMSCGLIISFLLFKYSLLGIIIIFEELLFVFWVIMLKPRTIKGESIFNKWKFYQKNMCNNEIVNEHQNNHLDILAYSYVLKNNSNVFNSIININNSQNILNQNIETVDYIIDIQSAIQLLQIKLYNIFDY